MTVDGRSEVSNVSVNVMCWRRWTIGWCALLGIPWGGPIAMAREAGGIPPRGPLYAVLSRDSLRDTVGRTFTLSLPVARPLAHPPAVAQVGVLPSAPEAAADHGCCTVEGAWVSMVTASVAEQDLRAYDRQLQSAFPGRDIDDPRDSLYQARVARADAWIARLTDSHDRPVSGPQLLALAMVAFRAERDTLVRHFIELRLAQVAALPAEQSLVLATVVAMLTDIGQRPARLASNFPVAESYASRLAALPATGYTTRTDSLDVYERQVGAIDDLLAAAERFRDSALLLGLANRLIPHLRAPQQARVRQEVEATLVGLRQIGHLVPPVTAHAWLGTPDSLYAPSPRIHPFDDGIVRLIAFGRRIDEIVPILDRIQRQVPSGVQVVFVTETEGAGGPDLLSPADEVTWLRQYYAKTRNVHFVIAVWAGDKVPQEPPIPPAIVRVPSARHASADTSMNRSALDTIPVVYQRALPTRSPVPARYRLLTMHAECVLVDGHGVVRGYSTLFSARDETDVIQRLIALR